MGESLQADVGKIIKESGLREFKWKDLSSAQHRFAAIKIIEWALPKLVAGMIRVDVLVWDIEDSRHKIQGRDDLSNLSRMYYHLFKNVLRERWPDESTWIIHPDENFAIDWTEMDLFLSCAGMTLEMQRHLSEFDKWKVKIKTEFSIRKIAPCKSHEQVFVQVADLIVGLAVYSRTQYPRFEQWRANSHGQNFFGFLKEGGVTLSRSDRERCQVLGHLDRRCKEYKMGVSLRTFKGLRSPKAHSPLNFWWYQPQIEGDKAPTRS